MAPMPDLDAVIHKYCLPFLTQRTDHVEVPIRNGKLLHVAVQHGDIHLWAAVDPRDTESHAVFRLAGTGTMVDTSWHHLGTVLLGDYVWHVFSELRRLKVRDA
jgi:hypothetical protein